MRFSPEIIRRIEAEIAKALEHQETILTVSQSDKRVLVIFDAAQIDLTLPLAQLDKCLQGGYVVTAIVSDIAAKLLDISRIRSTCGNEQVFIASEITNLQPFTQGFSAIVVPTLSYAIAAKLSLGLADTPCAYLLFQALVRKNKVLATVDGFGGSEQSETPPDISKLRQNYIETLSEFGIQFVAMDRLAEMILSDGIHRFNQLDARGGRNIITASVIAELPPDVREFRYANPAIITPLARDLAARKGIRLVVMD